MIWTVGASAPVSASRSSIWPRPISTAAPRRKRLKRRKAMSTSQRRSASGYGKFEEACPRLSGAVGARDRDPHVPRRNSSGKSAGLQHSGAGRSHLQRVGQIVGRGFDVVRVLAVGVLERDFELLEGVRRSQIDSPPLRKRCALGAPARDAVAVVATGGGVVSLLARRRGRLLMRQIRDWRDAAHAAP